MSQVTPPPSAIRNIVLVHGAFADGSSYAKVIPLLSAKGYHVVAVQNPLSSLGDDVAATKRAIALQDGPVILVGHSYAGMVITEAGNDPKVVGLVYIAAFAPDDGQSVADVTKPYPAPPRKRRRQTGRRGLAVVDAKRRRRRLRSRSSACRAGTGLRDAGPLEFQSGERENHDRRLEGKALVVHSRQRPYDLPGVRASDCCAHPRYDNDADLQPCRDARATQGGRRRDH